MATDTEAIDAIAAIMSGQEWSADTLDAIADWVRASGRDIADPFDDPPGQPATIQFTYMDADGVLQNVHFDSALTGDEP